MVGVIIFPMAMVYKHEVEFIQGDCGQLLGEMNCQAQFHSKFLKESKLLRRLVFLGPMLELTTMSFLILVAKYLPIALKFRALVTF